MPCIITILMLWALSGWTAGVRNKYSSVCAPCSSVKDQLMFIANFTPMALEDYQVNAPCAGTFTEILNSDEERFGGEGRVNKKPIQAKPCKAPVVPRPGEKIQPGKKYYELELYVPPLSVVVLRYDYKAE